MDSLKAAILGTQHPDVHETEREILLAAVTEGLQQRSGYIPASMAIGKPTMPPLADKYRNLSDILMRVIGTETTSNSNPRVPYLVLIWLLIGTENTHRLKQHVSDDLKLRQVAGILMRIAVGNANHQYTRRILLSMLSTWHQQYATTLYTSRIYDLLRSLLQAIFVAERNNDHTRAKEWIYSALQLTVVMTIDLRVAMFDCAKSWQSLPDEELWKIMSAFMSELLPPENSTS